ncbi:MAG: general secretion pathway protein GspK [Nitrospirota bacterium]|nr:general secretion pathway protein GspK [Nitrospirota bacterium]
MTTMRIGAETGTLIRNDRGVALLITLLVTTLLLALVFEFAYGTRVSLRAAANFRDSQRAYFLARSGVRIFTKYKDLKEMIPQGEWGVVPEVSQGDTEVKVMWEDEAGKIGFTDVKSNPVTQTVLRSFLEDVKKIDTTVFDRMVDPASTINFTILLQELRQYMSDEEYGKVANALTVGKWSNININTASADVLQSIGISQGAVDIIVQNRQRTPYTSVPGEIIGDNIKINNVNAVNYLTTKSNNIYTVHCIATVGGYSKEAVAIIGSQIPYWRIL